MAKIGTIPGYVTAVQNYAAKKGVPFATVPKAKPYNPYAYVPGGASPAVAKAIQTQGYATPYVAIPNASSIVQPNAGAGGGGAADAGDPYGDELTADRMYGIGQKNYADALAMGERSMLSDPINRLIQTYGYDPRTTALGDVASRYFDPLGLEAARKGGYTTSQQIERGFGQALAGVPTDLGMSGLQHSGSSAIIGDRLNYERGLSDKNAIDQLLAGIGTANQNWTDFQTGQADTWRQAQENIATRLAGQQGYHGPTDPSTLDYAGGAGSLYQPASDVQGVMDVGQGSGQWDSWTDAMNSRGSTYVPPAPVFKPAPATARLIQRMRAKGQTSAWETAMRNMGG